MELDKIQKEQIYKDFYGKVTRYVRGKVNDPHTAEDLVSDVFLKVYSKLDTFDESKASLSTWIYHITQNTVTDYFRQRRVFAEIPMDLSDDESVEDSLLSDETLTHLADGLEALDERSRDIILLHYYSGKKLTDIADGMGISYTYVKVLHKKALEALKRFV